MQARLSAVLLLAFAHLSLLACKKEAPREEPKAPWLASDRAAPAASRASTKAYFRLVPGSFLSFRLPAKEAAPSGVLRNVTGEIETTLEDLGQTRGTLRFDLASLALFSDTGADDAERTTSAFSWLGIGAAAPRDDQKDFQNATFELTSLVTLSSSSFERAAVISEVASKERVRRVTATAAGRFTLRRFAVDHRIPVQLDFHSALPEKSPLAPTRVVVHFPKEIRIPLSEHDVKPRDDAGRVLPNERTLVGRVVGSAALVGGDLEWTLQRTETAAPPQKTEP